MLQLQSYTKMHIIYFQNSNYFVNGDPYGSCVENATLCSGGTVGVLAKINIENPDAN